MEKESDGDYRLVVKEIGQKLETVELESRGIMEMVEEKRRIMEEMAEEEEKKKKVRKMTKLVDSDIDKMAKEEKKKKVLSTQESWERKMVEDDEHREVEKRKTGMLQRQASLGNERKMSRVVRQESLERFPKHEGRQMNTLRGQESLEVADKAGNYNGMRRTLRRQESLDKMSSNARNILRRQESFDKMSKDVSREYNTPRNMLRRQESIEKSSGEQRRQESRDKTTNNEQKNRNIVRRQESMDRMAKKMPQMQHLQRPSMITLKR